MSEERPKTDRAGESYSPTSHKRIAKNTVALYIRGLLSVCMGLYTSRVIIDTLGVDDYGVYGIAGGFVAMLAFILRVESRP